MNEQLKQDHESLNNDVADAEETSQSLPSKPKISIYELFMFMLSIVALVALGTQLAVRRDTEIGLILEKFDVFVCGIFFLDFVVTFVRAPNRWHYFRGWGWIDLLSSIPTVDLFRWGRAARILRIFRVLRGIRSGRIIVNFVLHRRAESALLGTALLTIILLILASMAVLQYEDDNAAANIKTAEQALWWAVTTVSTVGYGDLFPVSAAGRVVGAILMTVGVGLFAAFSGCVVAWVLGQSQAQQDSEIAHLRKEIAELKVILQQQNQR